MQIESVPAWIAALPFLGTAVILAIGQLTANFASSRLEQFVDSEKTKVKAESDLARDYLDMVFPSALDGPEMARRMELDIDLFQASAIILVPAVGITTVYFAQRSSGLILLLLIVPVLSGALTLLLATMNPGRYRTMAWTVFGVFRAHPVSFVTWLGIGLNLLVGIIAWRTAPATATVLHLHAVSK
jgi:hypothetical protein